MICINNYWLYSAPLDYLEKQQFILQVTFMSSDILISSQISKHQVRTGILISLSNCPGCQSSLRALKGFGWSWWLLTSSYRKNWLWISHSQEHRSLYCPDVVCLLLHAHHCCFHSSLKLQETQARSVTILSHGCTPMSKFQSAQHDETEWNPKASQEQ